MNYHKMVDRDVNFRISKKLRLKLEAEAAAAANSEDGPRAKSGRIAAQAKQVVYNPKERDLVRDDTAHWAPVEQNNLLRQLRAHGSRMPRRLARNLPTRSEESLRTFMRKVKLRHNYYQPVPGGASLEVKNEVHGLPGGGAAAAALAAAERAQEDVKPQMALRARDTPIEMWIELVERGGVGAIGGGGPSSSASAQDDSLGLPVLLDCISKGEDHPQGKVNYGAIYEMLSCLTAGEAPPDMNKETSNKVTEMMGRLLESVSSSRDSIGEERQFLEHFRLRSQRAVEEDGGQQAKNGVGVEDALRGLNPLRVPHSMIVSDKLGGSKK